MKLVHNNSEAEFRAVGYLCLLILIGLTFCMEPHMTPGRVYGISNRKKTLETGWHFSKSLVTYIAEKMLKPNIL